MASKKRPEASPNSIGFGAPGPRGTAGKQKAWNVAHKASSVLPEEAHVSAAGYGGFGDKALVSKDMSKGGTSPKSNLRSLKKAVKAIVPPNRAGDMRRVPKINPNDPEGHV